MADAQYPRGEDPRDEGRLADLTSAGMWTTAGVVGAAMFLLPGSPHEHVGAGLAIAGLAVGWGLFSLLLYLSRLTMSIGTRAVATAWPRRPGWRGWPPRRWRPPAAATSSAA